MSRYYFIENKLAKKVKEKKQDIDEKAFVITLVEDSLPYCIYELNSKFLKNVTQNRNVYPIRSINRIGDIVELFPSRETNVRVEVYISENFDLSIFQNIILRIKFQALDYLNFIVTAYERISDNLVIIEGIEYETRTA